MKGVSSSNKIVGWKSFGRVLLIMSLVFSLLPAVPPTVSAVTGVVYIDEHGVTQTQTQTQEVTVVDESNYSSHSTLNAGWYLFSGTWTQSGTIEISGDAHIILEDRSEVTVNGGIQVHDVNSLTIYAQSTGTNMGKLQASGPVRSAGIGGGQSSVVGTITINGGDITANAGGSGGAGIGGGFQSEGGTVTINGGKITAHSSAGAGIGGGQQGEGGTITINGGEITATGGAGAGIGGSDHGTDGTITIHGGQIIATGGKVGPYGGAGIGGASSSTGGTIVITGGDITATGGVGAGIGSSYQATGGSAITITGGHIIARGSSGSAGIGGGESSASGTVTINGGDITATVEDYLNNPGAEVIGKGTDGDPVTITVSGFYQ